MTERENQFGDVSTIIEKMKTGERPVDNFLAHCMEEIYLSGHYRTGFLYGAFDEKRILDCIRIVAIRDNELTSFVLSTANKKQKRRKQRDQLLRENDKLPINPQDFKSLSQEALRVLTEASLTTVAAMPISTSLASGKRIVEVCYPRVFMSVIPVQQDYQSDLGFGVSAYFLRTVPFGTGKIDMIIPSH